MHSVDRFMTRLTYWSLFSLSLFIFTSVSLSALHHVLILPAGLFFSYKALRGKRFPSSLSVWALLVMILWILLSVIFNWNDFEKPVKSLFTVKYFFAGLISITAFRYLIRNIGYTKKNARLLINTFLISTTVATLSGLVAILSGFNYLKLKPACHPFRACGLYGMTITYGYGISLFVLLLVGLLYFKKELGEFFNEKILWGALIINSLGMYLSYARGGLIAFLCGLISLLWFKNKKIFLGTSAIFLIGIVTLAYLTGVQKFHSRFLVPLKQSTNVIRIGQYQGAWYASLESPLFGKGFRNFEPQSAIIKIRNGVKYFPEWKGHAHNNFLEFLAGCGFIGFFAIIVWNFSWLRDSLNAKDPLLKLFTPFIVGVIISGLFQSTIIDGENMFLIMPMFGLFEALKSIGSNEQDVF